MKHKVQSSQGIHVIVDPIVVTLAYYDKENNNVGIVKNLDGQAFIHVDDGYHIEPSTLYPRYLDDTDEECEMRVPAPKSGTVLVAEINYFNGPFGKGHYVTCWGLYEEYVDAKGIIETKKKGKPAPVVIPVVANGSTVFLSQSRHRKTFIPSNMTRTKSSQDVSGQVPELSVLQSTTARELLEGALDPVRKSA